VLMGEGSQIPKSTLGERGFGSQRRNPLEIHFVEKL
jgi:hypothetical protein